MEVTERNLFPKSERLCLKRNIDRLFTDGHSFVSYPLRIVYLPDNGGQPSSSGISVFINVPKKRIRHAVRRNRVKRLIREVYRLNKTEISGLCRQQGKQLHVACIYICNEVKTYANIEKAMLKALKIIRRKENL
ncbi:MAG: ribonuclease P protein component [Tannerella sp.]|jgi:ribonuclease P protein component|nr:ribonuclease P protein component [Tannerella sp.]